MLPHRAIQCPHQMPSRAIQVTPCAPSWWSICSQPCQRNASNPTKGVTPMIRLLLDEEEDFDKLHPEAYTYENIGGNNSRCALELIHKEHPELATDLNFHTRPVSVYQNLTDDEAQYLAVKHNRATDFTHKMTTQDKVWCKYVSYRKSCKLAN